MKPSDRQRYKADMAEVYKLVQACAPLFHGKPPQIQGAALADLTAMWIAGHVAIGDPETTKARREAALAFHVKTVESLIPVESKLIIEPQIKRRQH
jgi:hypothetical protein